jgi:hypothetical protein
MVRIGAPRELDITLYKGDPMTYKRDLGAYISPRDLTQLFSKAIDHDCHPPPGSPDACAGPYPDGAAWADQVEAAFVPDVPVTYCGDTPSSRSAPGLR